MKRSRDLSSPDPAEGVTTVDAPQDPLNTEVNLGISSIMDPPQGQSTTQAIPSSVALTTMGQTASEHAFLEPSLEIMLDNHLVADKFPWHAHATGIIFGLNFLRCKVHDMAGTVRSYGFLWSMQEVLDCVNRYRRADYGNVPHPVDGPAFHQKILGPGLISTIIVNYVNEMPVALTHTYQRLRARTPLYNYSAQDVDGRPLSVTLTEGRLQFCVLD